MNFDREEVREDVIRLAVDLEHQIEDQGEAAKHAIREYKKAIRDDTASHRKRKNETRREVERAVNRYMQLRRRLDELRLQMNASQMPPRAG